MSKRARYEGAGAECDTGVPMITVSKFTIRTDCSQTAWLGQYNAAADSSYNTAGTPQVPHTLQAYSLDFGRRFDVCHSLDFILQSNFNTDFKVFLLPFARV